MFVCSFYLFSEKKTFPHSAPMTHTIKRDWGGNFIQVTVQDWGMYAYLWCSIPSIATMYNYRGSTSVHGISYLNRTSKNDLKISIVCKNRMTEMLNICRGKKELHETPYVVVTTFFNITVPSRLDFRRLPGPVFDPPRWVWAHFPEQRLVIEPTF